MWDILNFSSSLDTILDETGIGAITDINIYSQKHGLVLSKVDAKEIIETRNHALKSLGRVELGLDVIIKLITVFCNSPYINQSDYAAIINDLVEGFYYMKNETLDLIDDDDLIVIMKDGFDQRCYGSVDLLINRELEGLARYIREQYCYSVNSMDYDEV